MLIEIFTTPGCAQCASVRIMLKSHGVPFKEHRLGEDYTMSHLVEKFHVVKQFPVVVVDGFYIGGSVALRKYIAEEYKDTRKLLNEES